MTTRSFGKLPDGRTARLFTLTSASGFQVEISDFGGTVVRLFAPDRTGRLVDVVLGFDSVERYPAESPHFGAIIGRVGNRIAGGKFSLGAKTYSLATNNSPDGIPCHLHGGNVGFDKILWSAELATVAGQPALRLRYTSADGEEGYPGELSTEVTYSLTPDQGLRIDYRATTDQSTPVNLTNHSYFNLAGAGHGDVLDHEITLRASRFTPVHPGLIPTGDRALVAGTPFDFTSTHRIGARIGADHEQLRLGAGYDHFDGRHRDVVRRGLEWLVSVQQANGDLFVPSDPVSNSCAWLYSHGIATMALCEAVGMTGDPLLRPAAERAIGFIVASQQPGRGGWRYQPRADSDLSVSGWMLVALRAGTLAGLSVPDETYAAVRGLLDESASPDRAGHYLYNARNPGQRPSDLSAASMTALGSLMRLHTGTPRTDERLRTAAGDLAAMTPAYGTRQARSRDAYLWYYASQVLVQTGGPQWDAWYGRLCTVLEAEQVGDGDDAGSWEPLGTVPDRWGAYGGRLYVTALHLLALEVPYRHLPTYGVTDGANR